jgi:hypothetical protein
MWNCRGEGEQEQRRPRPFAHRAEGSLHRLRVRGKPAPEAARASEHLVHGHRGHGQERHELHHRLEGDGQAESGVALPRRDVTRTE